MASLDDIVSTGKSLVDTLSSVANSVRNVWPAATTTASPQATGINNLSTGPALVIANSATRHGLVFHNPGTATVYVFPTSIATTPATASVGGSFVIYAGGTLSFPSPVFPNANCSWSAFAGTGSNQALTIVEFY